MIWISSRGNGTTTFLPSFLLFPFFAYRCRDLFDIILPLEKVPNEFDSIPTNHRVGREKGGEELSHRAGWVFDRRINIRSIASLPSLIVALSCKEMVIYRKKWWFEDSLILTANTYIYIYILCIKESCVFKKNYCYYYDRMTGNGWKDSISAAVALSPYWERREV